MRTAIYRCEARLRSSLIRGISCSGKRTSLINATLCLHLLAGMCVLKRFFVSKCVFESTRGHSNTKQLLGTTSVTLRGPAHSMSKPNCTNLNQTLIPQAIWAAETHPEIYPSLHHLLPANRGHNTARREDLLPVNIFSFISNHDNRCRLMSVVLRRAPHSQSWTESLRIQNIGSV